MIADEYKLLYHNSTITYEKAKDMLLGDNATTEFEMLGEFVQSNFLKVNLKHFALHISACVPGPISIALIIIEARYVLRK